ncbi:hypothetical protein M3Y98_01202700 [Aphelenchoides besseyi]|nr:hypothetical protein M3Y98_01202700 [Aphelenchoides besseyi]
MCQVYDLTFDPTEFDQIEQTHRIVELISYVPTSTVAIFYTAFLFKQSLIPHCFKIIFVHISIAILGACLFRLFNSQISLYFLLMRQFFCFMFLAVVIVASLAYTWRVHCLINGQRISLMWFRVVSVLSIWLLTVSLTIPTLLGLSIDYSIVHFVRMLILFPVMLILRIELNRQRHLYYKKTERGNLDQRLQFSTLIHASRQIEIISSCVCVFTFLIFSTTWIQTIYIVSYCDVHLFRYFGIASNCLTNLMFFVLPTFRKTFNRSVGEADQRVGRRVGAPTEFGRPLQTAASLLELKTP